MAVLAELDPDRPVAVCRELTKLHEEIVRGSASELAARYASEDPRGRDRARRRRRARALRPRSRRGRGGAHAGRVRRAREDRGQGRGRAHRALRPTRSTGRWRHEGPRGRRRRDRRDHRRGDGRGRDGARRQRGARRRAARPGPGHQRRGAGAGRTPSRPSTSSDGEYDIALVAVKSPLHHVALPPLVERGGIGAFCSMGNGLIQDRMEEIVGPGQPAGLHRRVGRLERRPGAAGARLARRLHGRRARRVTTHDRARDLAAALEPVGRTRVTDNVRGMIWSKLLINSTFTGLSAVSGLRYGGAA